MSRSHKKGDELEDWVADQIVLKGIDPKARRDGGSGAGNREKSDIITSMKILGQNAGIECKNQNVLKIPEWWRQTKELESLGREPVLVFKIQYEQWEDTKCVIYLDTLLELIKNQKNYSEVVGMNANTIARERAMEQIIQAVEVLKK